MKKRADGFCRHLKVRVAGEVIPVILCRNAWMGDTSTEKPSKRTPVTCSACARKGGLEADGFTPKPKANGKMIAPGVTIAAAQQAIENASLILFRRPCPRVTRKEQADSCVEMERARVMKANARHENRVKLSMPTTDKMCNECAAYFSVGEAIRFLRNAARDEAERQSEAECSSCLGHGRIDSNGAPTIDGRARKCLDCRGEGKTS